MKRAATLFVLALIAIVALIPTGAANSPATPAATPGICPVTQPITSGEPPAKIGGPRGPGGYWNDALWTNLWMWGEDGVRLPVDDLHVSENGIYQLKWAWYRFKDGKLEITGRRLDGPSKPLEAWIPDGYGESGFQVTGISFPTAGCWEVTGRLGDDTLTFVVWVEIIPQATPISR